jgi:hypothetical protein
MSWVKLSVWSVLAASFLLLMTVALAPGAEPQPPVNQPAGPSGTPIRPHETHVQISPEEQGRQSREWLTAYMLTHGGYRLHHLDALHDTFGKMTPSQLSTLKKLHEEKHQATMRQQDVEQRMREHEAANAEAHNRMTDQQLNAFTSQQNQQGAATEQRLSAMHHEASANYRMNMQQKTAYGNQRILGGRFFW